VRMLLRNGCRLLLPVSYELMIVLDRADGERDVAIVIAMKVVVPFL
jgi:hypothetical protein